MGLRQRNSFDGVMNNDTPREDLNLTKYDEKYVFPTDSGAMGTHYGENTTAAQARTEQAAPASSEQNYVFGTPAQSADRGISDERKYVFGGQNERQDNRSGVFAQNGYGAGSPQPPFGQPAQQQDVKSAFDDTARSAERPMVFVLRSDKDMYVYEFSDRLEYYRRTEIGMVHCATKFRTAKR